MQHPRQDDALDLLTDAGTCRGCGMFRGLCALGRCTRCHRTAVRRGRLERVGETPVHLCCGWWGTRDALPWTCVTCGITRTRRRA
jgi:FPC/CPF motif-containing protein YcgG